MAKLNSKPVVPTKAVTHEGGPASTNVTHRDQLRRAIMACFLWEDTFYESGQLIDDRIASLIPFVDPQTVADYALFAREDMKLRHVPLLLVREMARGPLAHRKLVAKTLEKVVQRADELSEFLAIYWKTDPKQSLSAQVKKGLAKAFVKFNNYSLAKYKGEKNAVSLRDVMFLVCPRPTDIPKDRKYGRVERKAGRKPKSAMEKMFYALANQEIGAADTHEVAMSAIGQLELSDAEKAERKRKEWVRLIDEKQLGALALLKNLRNMREAGVDRNVIRGALENIDVTRILPHRFISAARFNPDLEQFIEPAMLKCAQGLPKLVGRTLFLIDVSGSMDAALSKKSDMNRLDAACGLAMIGREVCDDVTVCTFSDNLVGITARRGFALRDAIVKSQPHSGTLLGQAVNQVNRLEKFERIVVITDEQAADSVPVPNCPPEKRYMINVANYENGIGYGTWNKIDGFSENVIRYMVEFEKQVN